VKKCREVSPEPLSEALFVDSSPFASGREFSVSFLYSFNGFLKFSFLVGKGFSTRRALLARIHDADGVILLLEISPP